MNCPGKPCLLDAAVKYPSIELNVKEILSSQAIILKINPPKQTA